MSGFEALDAELDRWNDGGRRATLWWRDDDACRDTAALRVLIDIATTGDVPVVIAAIPAGVDASLPQAIAACAQVDVVQHGYAHRNHASHGERSCELGMHRGIDACVEELRTGRLRLEDAFGARFVPALVPPWNRIDDHVRAALPQAGLRGVSTFGPRAAREPVAGLVQCNTHVDLIAWRHGRGYIGDDKALARTIEHLAARRERRVDAEEPTGLLTHHLDMNDAAWSFVRALFACTRGRADWLDARTVFALPPATVFQSA